MQFRGEPRTIIAARVFPLTDSRVLVRSSSWNWRSRQAAFPATVQHSRASQHDPICMERRVTQSTKSLQSACKLVELFPCRCVDDGAEIVELIRVRRSGISFQQDALERRKIGFYPCKWTVFEIGHFGIPRWRVCQFRQSQRVAVLTTLAALAFRHKLRL